MHKERRPVVPKRLLPSVPHCAPARSRWTVPSASKALLYGRMLAELASPSTANPRSARAFPGNDL